MGLTHRYRPRNPALFLILAGETDLTCAGQLSALIAAQLAGRSSLICSSPPRCGWRRRGRAQAAAPDHPGRGQAGHGQAGTAGHQNETRQAGIGDCAWVRWLLERQTAQGHGRLVVDLSRLSSMDWWVAMMLVWAGRVVSRRGSLLVLASPQPAVARLLRAAGASKAVVVCDSVQQARGALAGQPRMMAESASQKHNYIVIRY